MQAIGCRVLAHVALGDDDLRRLAGDLEHGVDDGLALLARAAGKERLALRDLQDLVARLL